MISTYIRDQERTATIMAKLEELIKWLARFNFLHLNERQAADIYLYIIVTAMPVMEVFYYEC